jgi:hypothetical protein
MGFDREGVKRFVGPEFGVFALELNFGRMEARSVFIENVGMSEFALTHLNMPPDLAGVGVPEKVTLVVRQPFGVKPLFADLFPTQCVVVTHHCPRPPE